MAITPTSSAIATVRWRINGTPRPDLDDRQFMNFGCQTGLSYAVRVEIADSAGRNDVHTGLVVRKSGNP